MPNPTRYYDYVNDDPLHQSVRSKKDPMIDHSERSNRHHKSRNEENCLKKNNNNIKIQHELGETNRAIWIKTGNSLYSDIEYYEYTLPITQSSSSLLYRPPITPQSREKNPIMSEFARSAYMTAYSCNL